MTDTDIPAPVAEAIDVAREAARDVVDHEPQEGWNTLGDPDLGEGGSREWSVPDACTQAVLKVLMPEVRRLTAENTALENSLTDMRALEKKARRERDQARDQAIDYAHGLNEDKRALEVELNDARRERDAARREERERCAEAIFADEQRCQAVIVSDPTNPWMNGRLVGLQRARDIANALPDADPVCGADVDGHPCVREPDHHDIGPCNNRWPSGVPEAPATGLADRLIGADPDYIGGEDVDTYIARTRNRTTTEET